MFSVGLVEVEEESPMCGALARARDERSSIHVSDTNSPSLHINHLSG